MYKCTSTLYIKTTNKTKNNCSRKYTLDQSYYWLKNNVNAWDSNFFNIGLKLVHVLNFASIKGVRGCHKIFITYSFFTEILEFNAQSIVVKFLLFTEFDSYIDDVNRFVRLRGALHRKGNGLYNGLIILLSNFFKMNWLVHDTIVK